MKTLKTDLIVDENPYDKRRRKARERWRKVPTETIDCAVCGEPLQKPITKNKLTHAGECAEIYHREQAKQRERRKAAARRELRCLSKDEEPAGVLLINDDTPEDY